MCEHTDADTATMQTQKKTKVGTFISFFQTCKPHFPHPHSKPLCYYSQQQKHDWKTTQTDFTFSFVLSIFWFCSAPYRGPGASNAYQFRLCSRREGLFDAVATVSSLCSTDQSIWLSKSRLSRFQSSPFQMPFSSSYLLWSAFETWFCPPQ